MTRNHLIGGTDAASLIGLGRLSPVALYLRLRGEMPDTFEGNEATEAGNLFEDHVAVPLVKKHLGIDLVRPAERTLTLPDDPRIGASLDFEVAGKQELVDIKLTGSRQMWGNPGEKVPLHVAAQMQFQMAVARARGRAVPVVHVIAMFIPGFVMEDFEVEEDQLVGSALLDRARKILAAAERGEAPVAGDEADVRSLFLGRQGALKATPQIEALLQQIREVKKAGKLVAEQEQQLRDAVLPLIGDHTEVVDPNTGEILASFRANRLFDEDAFRAAHPDLWLQAANKIDRQLLEKVAGKKLVQSFMRLPKTPAEAVRVFRVNDKESK